MYTDGRYATAHIDYIDSVKFFEPSRVRTDVYQEIILGYLDHARSIWLVVNFIQSCIIQVHIISLSSDWHSNYTIYILERKIPCLQ